MRSVDPVGAELLLRVINAFNRASHELLLQGADQLVTPLRAAVEAGRRDPSDAVWMLLLEVFRLLNRQHDFEETGIQYCITYEVSPPSWEPPPPNLKTRAAVPQAGRPESGRGACHWRGTFRGDGEPHFGRLMAAARIEKRLDRRLYVSEASRVFDRYRHACNGDQSASERRDASSFETSIT